MKNETYKVFTDFEMQMDHLILVERHDRMGEEETVVCVEERRKKKTRSHFEIRVCRNTKSRELHQKEQRKINRSSKEQH